MQLGTEDLLALNATLGLPTDLNDAAAVVEKLGTFLVQWAALMRSHVPAVPANPYQIPAGVGNVVRVQVVDASGTVTKETQAIG